MMFLSFVMSLKNEIANGHELHHKPPLHYVPFSAVRLDLLCEGGTKLK